MLVWRNQAVFVTVATLSLSRRGPLFWFCLVMPGTAPLEVHERRSWVWGRAEQIPTQSVLWWVSHVGKDPPSLPADHVPASPWPSALPGMVLASPFRWSWDLPPLGSHSRHVFSQGLNIGQ